MQSGSIGDINDHCGNLMRSFNTTFSRSKEGEQIMHSLPPLEPNNRHQDGCIHWFDGVGNWLWERRGFLEWRGCESGVDKAVLFCSGNPGVDKK